MRIGFRITLIASLVIALIILTSMLALVWREGSEKHGFRLPLPHQIAALVTLVEPANPAELDLILTAVNSDTLRVEIQAAAPSADDRLINPPLRGLVARYISEMSGRPVTLMVASDDAPEAADLAHVASGGASPLPLRLIVTLRDGRFLVVETESAAIARFTGLRLALLVLLATLIISAAGLWALRRQLRPLESLARYVESIGGDLAHAPVAATGPREVRQLSEAIARMQARIRDLMLGRTRMIAAISHDLGTYLTRLRLRADFINDPTQRAAADRDIADMDALIADTLLMARLEQESEALQPTDLVALTRQVIDGFASIGAAASLTAAPDELTIGLQPLAFRRALGNVVANALRYGGDAEIEITQTSDLAVITVLDHGPGIPAEERELVLEAFYRGDRARNLDQPGSGLGLAIVADILRRHRGNITLDHRDGGGLRVTLTLPLTSP